jgi:tripartite-type tricarboxylate transporter receptor subunit TctC
MKSGSLPCVAFAPAYTRRAFVTLSIAAAAMSMLLRAKSFGESAYPQRAVRIVVPFLPGGGADLLARLISPHLQKILGQPFYVENRAGAAGRIGADTVAKASPDGHTLLMTTESSLVIAPHTGVPLSYDPRKDFAPISLLTRNPVMLVVHPSLPVQNLPEFIAFARAHPGELSFASSGVGGPNHLAGEIFNRATGLDLVHVPFPGTGGAIQAVIGNQVSAMWGFMAGLIPHVRAGALKALAVGSRQRSPALPEVPTVAESALPDYEATSWIGLLAPAAIAPAIVEMLRNAVAAAMQESAIKEALLRDGSDVVVSTPAEFRQVIETDYAKYGALADLLQSAK